MNYFQPSSAVIKMTKISLTDKPFSLLVVSILIFGELEPQWSHDRQTSLGVLIEERVPEKRASLHENISINIISPLTVALML